MKHGLAYLIVLILLLGGLLVSAFHSPIWYDDAGHYLVAREIARGKGMCYPIDSEGETCISDSPFITMGPVQAYPLGGWLALLGESMLAARMCMVLLSVLAMAALFWVARALTNSTKALIAVGILALNIQFLTYGSEVLGEVPMMGLILAGMGCFLQWDRSGRWPWAAGGLIAWCLAVGVKEYAIFPLGLGMLIWWLMREISKERGVRVFVLGLCFMVALGVTLILLHEGPDQVLRFFLERQSYGSEFLAFNLAISLKFLLMKPLFWLGTGAMVLKWRIKRRPKELLTLSMQAAWLVFYLMSAGYDRFGFLLLFLPAIYVAEFVPYLWKEAGRTVKGAWLRRGILIFIGFIVFSQQTWWVFGKRILHPEDVNAIERSATERIAELKPRTVVTAEQQMALFLEHIGQPYRLVSIVPSQGNSYTWPHTDFFVGEDEVLLAGPYAFTEYQGSIAWGVLEAVDTVSTAYEYWVIYRKKTDPSPSF